jgi:hypothetical protein
LFFDVMVVGLCRFRLALNKGFLEPLIVFSPLPKGDSSTRREDELVSLVLVAKQVKLTWFG